MLYIFAFLLIESFNPLAAANTLSELTQSELHVPSGN